jgi:hypothetical protein
MPEKPTTPDVVEHTRRGVEATNRGDLDATLSVYGPNSVWDNSAVGLGTNEGFAAIRRFIEDWWSSYVELEIMIEETRDLGNGVGLAILVQRGRPLGSIGQLELRYATVTDLVGGVIEHTDGYTDIDEARAAAERLADERG